MATATESNEKKPAPRKKISVKELRGRPLGRVLMKMGLVTRDQAKEAMAIQAKRRLPLGEVLIELGYVSREDIDAALAAQAGMAKVDLEEVDIPTEVVKMVSGEMAQSYQCIPVKYDKEKNVLTVGVKTASTFQAVDDLQKFLNVTVEAVIVSSDQLDQFLDRFYGQDDESIMSLIGEMETDDALLELEDRGQSIDLDQLVSASEDNKVKRLVNLVLLQAIKAKASDIHFEPFETEFKMRYRVDGVLYEMIPPPKHLAIGITSRVKVMANLDIAERRVPQDGRIELMVQGEPVDLRVSTLPTMNGESVVMRVLDRGNVQLDLECVGLREDDLSTFRKLAHKPNGIVIVTGPTGSGKTTTLYAALNELNDVETKILTAEDPVEYDIDGLVQVQVNEELGLTFERALRSFLRQDPDIILVGEVRDRTTAQIAVQASLTGHLVFTTLHTNDAPSSIARLLDIGLEPFLVTATLEGIVAQRLVRKICNDCKEEYTPSEEQLMELQLAPEDVEGRVFYRGKGCDRCHHSGYKGRLGLYEILVMDDELRELIMKNAPTSVLGAEARKRGMRTLRQTGLLAIYDGMTTIEEVVRETVVED